MRDQRSAQDVRRGQRLAIAIGDPADLDIDGGLAGAPLGPLQGLAQAQETVTRVADQDHLECRTLGQAAFVFSGLAVVAMQQPFQKALATGLLVRLQHEGQERGQGVGNRHLARRLLRRPSLATPFPQTLTEAMDTMELGNRMRLSIQHRAP
ncbi:hypothetical protein [Thioflavicoccus mobilis]|uniref:hypothetical protein n=1 Tax=Thioflavicoccus mobilis TaxID=80679 RepID=UPI0012FAD690|nr:hypothetical protein [Thioflavicoccus mobilis]